MLSDSFTYATRSLLRRRLRSWLTIIGIFIGIAAVVSLISLGQGMRDAIGMQFSSLGPDIITIQPEGAAGFGPPGLGAAVTLDESDLRVVQRAQHVEAAAGRILQPVQVKHNRKSVVAFLASLPEDREERDVVEGFLNPEPVSGRLLRAEDKGAVVLGGGFDENDQYAVAFGEPIEAGMRITIEGETFDVVGVLDDKGIPASDFAIQINEEDARALLDEPDVYSFIQARAASNQVVPLAKEAIEKDLRRHRGVEERKEDFSVETSEDTLRTVDDVLNIVTGVLVGIAMISLLVGGIGIMNTMYTAVVERTKEIGIMKAIGATNRQVLTMFLIESGMLGLVGALIGVLLGIGFSTLVELGAAQALGPSVLQASTPPWLLLGSLAFGFIVGALSGVLPAKRASELTPVEALR